MAGAGHRRHLFRKRVDWACRFAEPEALARAGPASLAHRAPRECRVLTDDSLDAILQRIPRLSVAVLGDLFLDRYLDIDAGLTEPSVETGLDAYQVTRVRSYAGAAGTVINNLAALGVKEVVAISVIGDDGEGHEVRQALASLASVNTGML